MRKTIEENTFLVSSGQSIDQVNAAFYDRFPYPWPPVKFECFDDPTFAQAMVNQDIGDWSHRTIPANAKIWVAGCGTNQALITAMRFPRATVLGSDLSAQSLATCRANAAAMSVSNLELRQENLNNTSYKNCFDYVICTGVIHHNADPRATLGRIAAALKPGGVLELMVYNRFHWTRPAVFQQAVRLLSSCADSPEFETKLETARALVANFPARNSLGEYLSQFADAPESEFADVLLQPVLYSYTVESLAEMTSSWDLHFLSPCANAYDKLNGTITWNLTFSEPDLQCRYAGLPDLQRWQITNLLLLDSSPYLWFYFRRGGEPRSNREREIAESYLETIFERAGTTQRAYLRNRSGAYESRGLDTPYPPTTPQPSVVRMIEAVDGKTPMKEIWQRLGLKTEFDSVNLARILTTTSAYPYLRAVQRVSSTIRHHRNAASLARMVNSDVTAGVRGTPASRMKK